MRLNFGAMALRYPERLRFRYRIEGIDRDWVDIGGQRSATFTPAAPGHHRFLLQARNEDGVWSVAPVALELAVLPAWWQTNRHGLPPSACSSIVTFGLYHLRVQALEGRHHERVQAWRNVAAPTNKPLRCARNSSTSPAWPLQEN